MRQSREGGVTTRLAALGVVYHLKRPDILGTQRYIRENCIGRYFSSQLFSSPKHNNIGWDLGRGREVPLRDAGLPELHRIYEKKNAATGLV